jgi:type IV pilus assembly protein PilQ
MPTRAFRPSFIMAFLFATLMLAGGIPLSAAASQAYTISGIKPEMTGNALYITIKGDSQPTYIVTERYSPFRVALDIANAVLPASGGVVTLPKNNFVTYTTSTVEEQEAKAIRFEFKIAESHGYKVVAQGNDIQIAITPTQSGGETAANPASGTPTISDMQVQQQPGVTTVKLVSATALGEYKTGTLRGDKGNPARMFIDIPNVSIGKEVAREKTVHSSVLTKVRLAPRGNNGVRVIFDAGGPALFEFSVNQAPDGIQVVIKNDKTADNAGMAAVTPEASHQASATVGDTTLDKLIESSSSLLQKSQGRTGGNGAQDAFLTSGYSKERISVDFYKIDIHNVFRLFREVSNLNIIVDEGVKGTLTLALNDVPWDFALDIICNLMDLSKEQRSNTIVIYPRKKEFVWPSRSEDNLSVNADQRIVDEQALVIQQTESQPEGVVRARELMRNAAKAEKNGDFEQAAGMYEEAVSLNPKNSNALDRLTELYLVNLGVNAKALYYAKQSLRVSPQNRKAALYAAIASANMQQTREASDYFAQSISGNPPMKEALLSFAAFAENNRQYDSALVLLNKYAAQYGDSLNTMVAKARIYDKQDKKARALTQYKAILTSGFALHPELRRYAQERLAAGQ